MTTATLARSDAGFLIGSERNLGTRTVSLREAWDKYLAYRTTLAELKDLTDRQLADIGIGRAALEQVARRAVYGNSPIVERAKGSARPTMKEHGNGKYDDL